MREPTRTSSVNVRGMEDQPVSWEDICRRTDCQGRWIALDECAYNDAGEATAGSVVDFDDNLADLCARMSAERRQRCAIVFCPPADHRAA